MDPEVMAQPGDEGMAKAIQTTSNPGNDKLQPLADHCFTLLREFGGDKPGDGSQYRRDKIEEIKASRKAYEQKADPKTFPWDQCSNIVVPLLMITVDNLEPRLVAGLIGRKPYCQFQPTTQGEKKDPVTEMLEDWWNKELEQVVKIEGLTMSAVHQVLLEGTIYVLPRYDIDEVERADYQFDEQGRIKADLQQGPVLKKTKETVFEGGRADFIPFTDVYIADDVGNQEQWEKADKIVNVGYTYGELMKKNGKHGWMNIGPWIIPERAKRKISLEDKTPAETISNVEITGKEYIECIQCHISYPTGWDMDKPEDQQTNFDEEYIIVTLTRDSKTIIRVVKRIDVYMRNQSILRRVRLFPEEGRSYGTSMYGKLKDIQQGASDIFNNMLDAGNVAIVPFFFYDERSGLKGEVSIHPGKGIAVSDVNGIKFPTFSVDPARMLTFLEFMITLWERVGSIGDWQIGLTNEKGGKRTKAEVLNVLQEGSIKHNYQAKTTRDEFQSIITTLYDLYYEYMPVDKTFVYQGKTVPVPRAAMRRGGKFHLSGSTEMANKAVERQEATERLSAMGQDPLIDPIKIREDWLKTYGITDTQQYIRPQVWQLYKILEARPEIMQVIGNYLQELKGATEILTKDMQGGAAS